MPLEPPKDDPSVRRRAVPPTLQTDDNQHIPRVVSFMKDKLTAAQKVRDDMKTFMVLAWMVECDLPVSDCVLVNEQIGPGRQAFYFAEKLPRDERFAQQYDTMKKEHRQMKDELCRAMNEIAALKTEIANLRGENL